MRFALDTSVFVAFFLREDKYHNLSKRLIDKLFTGKIGYACTSVINIAETGYVIERVTDDENYAYSCMYAIYNDIPIDIINVTWDFITTLAHFKAKNPISFCDNATLTAAYIRRCKAVFTKEKEIITRKRNIIGAEIAFIDELNL
ncbi:MAG: PIN domain-containing protein [Candidatus Odinarchaeota archaeon]|nr:PIN domain-containing protein [Candidatus Odinarchaeota archaeon]